MATYKPKSRKAEEFIHDGEIQETLEYAEKNKNNVGLMDEILEKARPRKTASGVTCAGLTHREASVLLACEIPEKVAEINRIAEEIKLAFYGNRIVIFAPLNPIEYILECIHTIYGVNHKNGSIRRVNVNIAATTVENYRKLKEAGIGTYILFQETYHKESYLTLHPTGPKHDYAYHTEAMDRAMDGGIDDVGLGVLFGLERYKYEFAGLIMHAEHLEAVHGVGPHTISVPRVKHADDIDPNAFDNSISDEIFAKITACIRLAVPYTGMIVSTRESEEVRGKLLRLGVSQVSGASRTSVGGYTQQERPHDTEQFDVSDQRTLDEVVRWLMENGHIPSFCTACYREGRTGDRFMSLCKSGQILNCCHPNALMTLTEYLEDYASEETRRVGYEMIHRELERIPSQKVRDIAAQNIADIRSSNRRDFRF